MFLCDHNSMKPTKLFSLMLIATIMVGCASIANKPPASESAVEKKVRRSKEWRPDVYVIQKGDTLYSIAFNYGFGYRELAELNGIKNPNAISIGQAIRLFPDKAASSPIAGNKASEPVIKDQPKLVKYAYSDSAMALIDKVQLAKHPGSITTPTAPIVVAPVKKEEDKPKSDDYADDEIEEPALDWGMPTQGKLIAQFSESENRKGIDISGKLGQPVLASAAGKVVYSGSGLRGYGKLIIIKHNVTYLTAYAHNDKILVKEGQPVSRGQKIAAMGSTDSDRIKLHFEVRRFGKPVDPAKFLSLAK